MKRGPGGKLLVWTTVFYGDRNVFGKHKQLNVGKSGVQLKIGKDDAKAAGIPVCILKETGDDAGKFQRNVYAYDKAGKKVKLATFSKGVGDKNVVTPCSAAALASVAQLGPALKGQGAETDDKVKALKRFSITLASAPAAAEEEDEEEGAEDEEEEEGAEDEEEGDEDDA
jgi:hypothetical protein